MKKLVPKDAVLIPESAECVFKGKIFDVYQWSQKMFNDSKETFEMLRRPDTTMVIGVVEGKIMVIDDEQPNRDSKLNLPGGRVDESEEPLTAAKREVKEETGYEFEDWKLIEVIQPYSKLEWFIYYYVADGAHKVGEPKLDAGEKIKLELVDFEKAKHLAFNKAGYLGYVADIFEITGSLDGLKTIPEFVGQEIGR